MKSRVLEPFWQELKDGTHPEVEYTDKQTYKKLNLEAALAVLKEFMDAPDEELGIDKVKEDFAAPDEKMSDDVAQRIVEYYNGRKKIYDKLKELLESGELEYEKVEIPEELNRFATKEDDEKFEKCHTIEAWIEVRSE